MSSWRCYVNFKKGGLGEKKSLGIVKTPHLNGVSEVRESPSMYWLSMPQVTHHCA